MTQIDQNTCATDLDDQAANGSLTEQGYTIRHIETWHDLGHSCIVWDAPPITDADCPF